MVLSDDLQAARKEIDIERESQVCQCCLCVRNKSEHSRSQCHRSETRFSMTQNCLVQATLAEAEEHRNAAQIREQRLAQQLAQNELDRQSLSQVPFRSHQTKLLCKHPRLLAVS